MKVLGNAAFIPAPLLLCLDLQREQAIAGGPAVSRCIEECRRILRHARRMGWHVAHVHRQSGLAAGLTEHCRPIEGLEPHPREPVFYRERPSAFASPAFRDLVARLGDPRIVVVGFSQQSSALFTAVASCELGLPVTVVEGALGAAGSKRSNRAEKESMLFSVLEDFTEVVSTDRLLEATRPWLVQAANLP
jgi:nicotinamidase-related amidase